MPTSLKGKAKKEHPNALEIGEGLFLQELTLQDQDEFISLNRVSRQFHTPWVSPPLDAISFAKYFERAQQEDFKAILIHRLTDSSIVGVYNMSQIVRGLFQNAYLGYYVGAPFARQGYMTEGMKLLFRYTFTNLKLHRLEANIQPENKSSIALVKRCGFQLEGYSPRYLKIRNRWRDHDRWAIRAETWRAGFLPK